MSSYTGIHEVEPTDGQRRKAAELGFSELVILDDHGSSVIWVRWRGAPVVIKGGCVLRGGFGVAFYRGEDPAVNDEDTRFRGPFGEGFDRFDIVAETDDGDPELLMELAELVLTRHSGGRETQYCGVPR